MFKFSNQSIRRNHKRIAIGLLIYIFLVLCYIHSFSDDNPVKTRKPTPDVPQDFKNLNQKGRPTLEFKQENRETLFDDVKYEHLLVPQFPLAGALKNPKPVFEMGHFGNFSDIVIGITTIKREVESYLIKTISSLLDNQETDDAVVSIVVMIAESDLTFVEEKSKKIQKTFHNHSRFHQLKIISPPDSYYPIWTQAVRPSLGDDFLRSKWRSKQNLDQIFLMMYIYQRSPTYYVMLEDDVITQKGYVAKMLQTAYKHRKAPWFYISFCTLGAIGKLFKLSTLPPLASFIHIFWNRKPLDWLLVDYASVAYCRGDDSEEQCRLKRNANRPFLAPSLFQHVGKYSSLNGKIQELEDESFHQHKD